MKKCKSVTIENINIIVGNIASGDIFCTDIKMKEKIREKFNCDCVEMEGAAIAQAAHSLNKPFIVVRAMSDTAAHDANITFDEFIIEAGKQSAKILMAFLEKLA